MQPSFKVPGGGRAFVGQWCNTSHVEIAINLVNLSYLIFAFPLSRERDTQDAMVSVENDFPKGSLTSVAICNSDVRLNLPAFSSIIDRNVISRFVTVLRFLQSDDASPSPPSLIRSIYFAGRRISEIFDLDISPSRRSRGNVCACRHTHFVCPCNMDKDLLSMRYRFRITG